VIGLSVVGAAMELAGIVVVAGRGHGLWRWVRRHPIPELSPVTWDDISLLKEYLEDARRAPVPGVVLLVLGLGCFVAANIVGLLA